MQHTLVGIQYQPGGSIVGLLIEHALGSYYLVTTQAALAARDAESAEVWNGPDVAALAEAQALLDGTASPETQGMQPAALTARVVGKGFTVALPAGQG